MKKYEGYYSLEELPFKVGQAIILPPGIIIVQYPRGNYILRKKMIVKLNHYDQGINVNEKMYHTYYERYLSDLKPLDEKRRKLFTGDYPMYGVKNPHVVWVASSKYWASTDINQILKANGLEE
jgi:hypothetical protein